MKKLLLGTVGSLCLGGLAFADPPVFPDNEGIDEAKLASTDAEVPNDKFDGIDANSGVEFGQQVSDLAKGGGVADAVSGGASSSSSASSASSAPGASASASGVGNGSVGGNTGRGASGRF